jgi:hypothetical protein
VVSVNLFLSCVFDDEGGRIPGLNEGSQKGKRKATKALYFFPKPST